MKEKEIGRERERENEIYHKKRKQYLYLSVLRSSNMILGQVKQFIIHKTGQVKQRLEG